MLVKKLHDIGMARKPLTPLPSPPPGRRSGSGGAGEGRVSWGREGGPVGHCHRGMALTFFALGPALATHEGDGICTPTKAGEDATV
jgi:hypothetical protein